MKILQIIQKPQLRGAEIFACQLSTELISLGNKVDIAYLFADAVDLITTFPNLNFIGLHGDKANRFLDWKAFRMLSNLIKSGKYDVVQSNAGDTLKYAVFSKMLFGWNPPLIFRNANQISLFVRSPMQKILNGFLLNRTSWIISVSENCRLDLEKLFPSAIGKTVTIPIGTYNFEKIVNVERESGYKVILNIGSFVPEKNHSFLLDVFAELLKRHQNIKFWLIGDGVLRPQIEEKARNLGISNNLTLFGYRADAIAYLRSSDVLLMPSRIEGLPAVILEAFSCGVPVVASSVGGIPEVVKTGVTGMCLSNWNVNEYVDAVDKFLGDAELRRRVTTNAVEKVKNEYMMELVSARFLAVYEQLSLGLK